jgi:hypothetical protein
MIIKKIEDDGTIRVWGEVTHYMITRKPIESGPFCAPVASNALGYLRMFRGNDVNSYGPFDSTVDYSSFVYIMDDTGKTVDRLDANSLPWAEHEPAIKSVA